MTGCARCGGKWKFHGTTILLTDFEERRLKVNVLMCQDCQSVIVVDPERKKQFVLWRDCGSHAELLGLIQKEDLIEA